MRVSGYSVAVFVVTGILWAGVTCAEDRDRGVRSESPKAVAASNSFLDLFWLTQHVGRVEAVEPGRDAETKAAIGKALNAEKTLALQQMSALVEFSYLGRFGF